MGALTAVTSGTYNISVNSTGAVDLQIDGNRILSLPDGNGLRTGNAAASLAPGPHRMDLQYRLTHDLGVLELLWRPPGSNQAVVIPPEAFS